jgi:hypothetical protein
MKPAIQSGCILIGLDVSATGRECPDPTSRESPGPVAADGDTIMATESRTREKPIMIFPVFIITFLVICCSRVGDTPNHTRVSPDYQVFSVD